MGKKGGRRPRAAKPRGVLNAATVGTALCVLALAIAVGLMARQLGGRSIAVRVTAGGGVGGDDDPTWLCSSSTSGALLEV